MTVLFGVASAVRLWTADGSLLAASLFILLCVFTAALILCRGLTRTSAKLARFAQLKVPSVRVTRGEGELFENPAALEASQVFVVRAGERFVTDGIVEEGNSQVDESVITGNHTPRPKEAGKAVFAGTLNLEQALRVRATHTAAESSLERTIALLRRAFGSQLPLEHWVDFAGRVVFPAIAFQAGVLLVLAWTRGLDSFREALWRAIAMTLVAYPFAMRLATRPVVNAAVWAASRAGILIRDATALETLDRVGDFVFNKTGVITDGNFELLGCELVPDYCSAPAWMQANAANPDMDPLPCDFPFALSSSSYEQIFELLASTEQHAAHPVGVALVNFACERGIPVEEATCTEVHKGLGITGIVESRSMFIGGRRLVEGLCVFVDARSELVARRWESEGKTVVLFGWDGALRGCLALGDAVRPHATELIAYLKRLGVRSHLLSGDSCATTETIARQLGTETCRSDFLAPDKADFVHTLRKRGSVVAMVGHPIDEAPALAAADVGIAMGGGTDWGSAASVILMDEDLAKLARLAEIAKKTMRTVRQNLAVSISCSAVGIVLAIYGVLNPVLAALFVLASGLAVVGNSMHLEAEIRSRQTVNSPRRPVLAGFSPDDL